MLENLIRLNAVKHALLASSPFAVAHDVYGKLSDKAWAVIVHDRELIKAHLEFELAMLQTSTPTNEPTYQQPVIIENNGETP